ncbi:MAG: hypothetical protein WEA56_03405 [Balneolaceae bacterium]
MKNDIPEQDFKKIEEIIGSDESVVGIDAKKTHIIIIHMLQKIEDKLDQMEQRLKRMEE